MSDYLTIQDVAEIMGVEYKTVYRLVTSGKIPSFRVGRVYRIRHQDLNAYIEAQIGGRPATTVGPLTCGYCGAAIPSANLAGGPCEHEECDEMLCANCWAKGVRACRLHQPTSDQRLTQAKQALAQGQVDRVVTALQARQRELAFLTRFDERILGIAALQNPLDGELLKVKDWSAFHQNGDESTRLLEALGVAFLERSLLAVTPVNARSRYELTRGCLGFNHPRQALIIEAKCLSDLETQVRQGHVTAPTSIAELMVLLNARQTEAEQANALLVQAIAATAGWDQESIDYISASSEGRSYRHRLLLPVLVDLNTTRLHYNATDKRLQGFVGLFRLAGEAEEILRVQQWIEATIEGDYRSGVTLPEVIETLGVSAAQARRAFQQLATQPRFRLLTDADTGEMLVVVR